MSQASKIEWTESTWNPVTGCTKISPGCLNCYAERMTRRLQAMGQPNYRHGFNTAVHSRSLQQPLVLKKPQMIFVNSMSDLFHDKVPAEFILRVFDVMDKAFWHTYQILTKRAERLIEMDALIDWPDNVWMGVSVETREYKNRIEMLKRCSAKVKFLSCEPLLGSLGKLDLKGIDWVIAGGESGPGARPIDPEWVEEIRDQCLKAKVPFFFKQWGGFNKKKAGRLLDGKVWDQMPKQYQAVN